MSDESSVDFRQPNGRFAKGNPGGPGRPRARDRIEALDQLVAGKGPELIEAALKAANAGNVKAIEMLLGRIWPAARGRPVVIEAPVIRTNADLLPVTAAVTNAVMSGDATPEEGAAAARVISAHEKVLSGVEFDRRAAAIEAKLAERKNG
ncbi:MAG TPA: hypothetical protein VEC60_01870 [Reyranella sp.]|nr:hypothetical protein [Reyranella sp.]